MFDVQPQERGTQQNTLRECRKPVLSFPPFGTFTRYQTSQTPWQAAWDFLLLCLTVICVNLGNKLVETCQLCSWLSVHSLFHLPLEWLSRLKKERCFQQSNCKEITSLFPKFTHRVKHSAHCFSCEMNVLYDSGTSKHAICFVTYSHRVPISSPTFV